jgi:hypothetical protein
MKFPDIGLRQGEPEAKFITLFAQITLLQGNFPKAAASGSHRPYLVGR